MSAPFSDFLDAKFALDERSLNADVRQTLLSALEARVSLSCLDAGMGTGATLRRLLSSGISASLQITGVDTQPDLLALAQSNFEQLLRQRNFQVRLADRHIFGISGDRTVEATFVCSPLQAFSPAVGQAYDLIAAHALMDIVPVAPTVGHFKRWLIPGGLLYATLNYDGGTTLLPAYEDEHFEDRLLREYDASMEKRLVDGATTGASRSGRRLHAALIEAGFDIIACGSSDWNLTPQRGAYRDQDAICLRALLEMIHGEGQQCADIDAEALSAWHETRRIQIATGTLGLIVHQFDILAESP